MRIKDNCRGRIQGTPFTCPFLRSPMYHSGFTGKSGPETWWPCLRWKAYIRDIKECDLSGKPEMQRDTWIEHEAKEKSDG